MKKLLFVAVLLLALAISNTAKAEEGLSKVGLGISTVVLPGGASTVFSWRYLHFVSNTFAIGGAGMTGQVSSGGAGTGSLSYGGLVASFNAPVGRGYYIEFATLAGGGGGFNSSGLKGGGVVLEPTLAFNFLLGKRVGLSVFGGYLWMPTSRDLSGISGGVRFEFFFGGPEDRTPASILGTIPNPAAPRGTP